MWGHPWQIVQRSTMAENRLWRSEAGWWCLICTSFGRQFKIWFSRLQFARSFCEGLTLAYGLYTVCFPGVSLALLLANFPGAHAPGIIPWQNAGFLVVTLKRLVLVCGTSLQYLKLYSMLKVVSEQTSLVMTWFENEPNGRWWACKARDWRGRGVVTGAQGMTMSGSWQLLGESNLQCYDRAPKVV